MNKRFLALLLALAGLIALGLVIWFIVLPTLRRAPTTPPPTTQNPPVTNTQQPTVVTSPPVTQPLDSAEERERQAQEALKRFSMDATSRAYSYANTDGFLALQQAALDATPAQQARLAEERAALLKEHPQLGPSWGVTTKGLSAKITGGTPLLSSSLAVVVVQAQRTTTEAGKEPVVSYSEIRLSLEKSGEAWKISSMTETALEL